MSSGVPMAMGYYECAAAVHTTLMRMTKAHEQGLRHAHNMPSGDLLTVWERELVGALGELAVAKLLNVYVAGNGRAMYDGDLPGGVEVRTTTRANGCLILHKTDDPDARFYLVVGRPPRLTVAGWILGRDGMRAEWWRDPTDSDRWAFFVPQDALEQP